MDGTRDWEGSGVVEEDIHRGPDRLLSGVEFHTRRIDENVMGYFIVIDDVDRRTACYLRGVGRESAVVLTDRHDVASKNQRRRRYRDKQ